MFDLQPAVITTQVGILTSMLFGTIVRYYALRNATPDIRQKRLASLRTWWLIAGLFCLSVTWVPVGGLVFFALVSLMAVKEYMTLTGVSYQDWGLVRWAYVAVLLNYLLVYLGWHAAFVLFIPLGSLLVVSVRMVVRERAEGFLLAASSFQWGMMLTVYCIAHAPLLLTLPADSNPTAGPVGWFIYLLLLTAASDIFQALIGRRLGRHYLAPVLSPHKTWEGLIGGGVVIMGLAMVLSPLLTPLDKAPLRFGTFGLSIPFLPAALAGLLITLGGYFGDLTISGIKRDRKVKDSGMSLPGQGGILDRIDSLTFTAPLFYYFIQLTSSP
jgi:phosphatidate cytidylyltransferase